jgi:CubicO group peptidase (beta-lactamase class C family)
MPDARKLAILILSVCSVETASAQQLQNQSPGQMRNVVREALASGKRVSAIQPKIVKQLVVFDVTLVPNRDKTEWMTLLNLTPQQFTEARARYGREGYTVSHQASIIANGQNFVSTVWLRTNQPVWTLALPAGRLPEAGEIVDYLTPVDKLMRTFVRRHNAAGVTVAIAKEGKVVYQRAFGWSDANRRRHMAPDTPMRIADISKSITAVAAMQLVEKGQLELDAPVIPLMTGVRFKGVSSLTYRRWHRVTTGQLLRHRGGWDPKVSPDPMFRSPLVAQELKLRKDARPKDVVQYQLRRDLDFEPGVRFAYSDFGYCLLGRVIEIAADRPYGSYVLQNILKPLELQSTKRGRSVPDKRPKTEAWYHMQREQKAASYWSASQAQVRRGGKTIDAPDIVRKPDGVFQLEIMDSHGAWVSTATELVRFMSALEHKQSPLVKPETLKAMLAPSEGDEMKGSWYGSGFWVRRTEKGQRFWHGGAMPGSSTLLTRNDDGVVWAVLFNTDVSKTSGKTLAGEIDPLMIQTMSKVNWPQ